MGTTFSTIQINNHQKTEPVQLQEMLCRYMKRKGFVPAAEDDAELSFRLIFSDHSHWVTLCFDDDDHDSIHEDAPKLAELLQTHCIITSVWDSDMVELHLFGASADERDTVVAGRPPWGEMPSELPDEFPNMPIGKGVQKQWEPLLVEGATWERLKEIWNTSYTFAEDAFSEMAPLLGMDAQNIRMDFRFSEILLPGNPNVVTLRFKSAGQAVPLLIREGATKLYMGSAGNPIGGEKSIASFYNTGGVSTGVCAFFIGDCIENEVEISEVIIRRLKDPKSSENAKYPDDYEIFATDLRKIKCPDGRYGYFAYATDYTFFEGINLEHPSMAGNKRYGTKSSRTILGYTSVIEYKTTVLSGQQHKLRVGAAPLSNRLDGQASLSVKLYQSREVFEFLVFAKKPSTPGPIRENTIKELTNQAFLADIAENDEDDNIRKIAAERLAKLKGDYA